MNTRTALVAISRKGASLVQDLEGLEGTKDVFVNRRWFVAKEGHKPIDLPIKTTIQTIFSQYQNIIVTSNTFDLIELHYYTLAVPLCKNILLTMCCGHYSKAVTIKKNTF